MDLEGKEKSKREINSNWSVKKKKEERLMRKRYMPIDIES